MSRPQSIQLLPSLDLQVPASVAIAPSIPRLAFALELNDSNQNTAESAPLLSPSQQNEGTEEPLSRSQSSFVIISVAAITAIGSLLAGVITVAIPRIAEDISLEQSLLLWPASIFALVAGCTLLLSGSLTDILGSKFMYLSGTFLQCTFVLACGLARTGPELIAFRALSGLANSMCLPSAVSIITNSFATGKRRNYAFAAMGGGQPAGFGIGLTVGGVLTDTIGWRWAFYLAAILTALVGVLAAFFVPKDEQDKAKISWARFAKEVDWVGAGIASCGLAGFSYVLASVTNSLDHLEQPLTASLLAASLLLLPLFSLWVDRQTRNSLPALIPNALWKSRIFTSINLAVFLIWGSFNAIEQLLSFYFQYVQHRTALTAALYFLPAVLSGITANVVTGALVPHLRADYLLLFAMLPSLVPSLVMALASPGSSYWASGFPATALNPLAPDALFTISNLVITGVFPQREHGLAGGVFNTVAQVGKSVGLAMAAAIANAVSRQVARGSGSDEDMLMTGYRAAFWFCFVCSAVTLPVVGWGLRAVGKVGEKRD